MLIVMCACILSTLYVLRLRISIILYIRRIERYSKIPLLLVLFHVTLHYRWPIKLYYNIETYYIAIENL